MENLNLDEAKKNRDEAQNKLNELKLRKEEYEERIKKIEVEKRDARNDQENESSLTRSARALLNGEDIVKIDVSKLDSEMSDLRGKIRVLNEAARIQEGTLQETTAHLSRAMGQAKRPEYIKILKEHVRTLFKAGYTKDALTDFVDDFKRQGLSWSLAFPNASAFFNAPTMRGKYGTIHVYLQELIRDGYLTQDEVDELKNEDARM